MSLLSVRELSVQYPSDQGLVRAVDAASFEVPEGGTLAVVGESGSGKSQSMLGLLGLVGEPGTVSGTFARFEGEDLLRCGEKRLRSLRGDRIGMIFQDPMTALNPFLTVARQLTEVLEVHRGRTRRQARSEALAMLELVGIPDPSRRIDQHPHQFSGGMRQRVMIAMALLCRPRLLIADEPTTALDVTIQAQILELLARLQREMAMSIVLITHDLGVVAGMADRIAVMYAGRVVEEGPADALFASPQHPYTRGLLDSVPRLDVERRSILVPIRGQPPDPARLPPGCPFQPRCPRAVDLCRTVYPSAAVDGDREVTCHLP